MKTKIYKRKNWNVDTPLHKGLNSLELNIEESSKNIVNDLDEISQSLKYIDEKNIEQDYKINKLEDSTADLNPRIEYLETEVSTIREDMEGIVSGELNNVYTKSEADSKFVGKTATTVSIEDKRLLFSNNIANTKTGETSQGKINISEDGLDVKSNHSVSVVVNEDNLGDGYFRVYTGSGRKPLLEVGERILRYGENASKIYHEEFKPTKTDVGLSKVENLTKSEIITGLSTTTELTNAVSTLNTSINGKLGKTETATNSSKLENFTKDQIVTEAKNGMAVDSLVTTSTKGLMSNSDKSKLDGIANNANNYSHPSTHPASIIVEDSTHRFMTDAEKSSITSELSSLKSSKLDKSTYSGTAQDLKTEINTKANSSNTITAGNGLQGGGTLGSNVSLSIKPTNESLIVDSSGIKANIVDNLTAGGVGKSLSAEQGKVLKQLIDAMGSGGAQKLLREAEVLKTYEFIGNLPAGGKSIMIGTTLFNPKLYLDGTRIDPNQYSVELSTGLITLTDVYSASYDVVWFIEDTPNHHISFCFPTMNLLTSDAAMKNKIEIGDVVKILGSSDADDGGHYLVKCSATAGLNAVNIGSNKYLNEIANTKVSDKLGVLDKAHDSSKLDGKTKEEIIKESEKSMSKSNYFEKVCFYYGYPISINGAWKVDTAVSIYSKYDMVVFGDNYNNPTHQAHADTVLIINKLKEVAKETKIVGYVPCAVSGGSKNLTTEQIKERINMWHNLKINGIFLDEFGYDYQNTRERQNEIISYVKNLGMFCFVNSWEDKYVYSNLPITISWLPDFHPNPNSLPCLLDENDYSLYENFLWDAHTGVQKHQKPWVIYKAYDYYNKIQSEFGKSFYEQYKTKTISLDGITREIENEEQGVEMRTISIFFARMLNISGIAFGDQNWGSTSNFKEWTLPEQNLKRGNSLDGISVTMIDGSPSKYESFINGDSYLVNWTTSDMDMGTGVRELFKNGKKITNAWETIDDKLDMKLDKSGGVLTGDTIIKGTGNTLAFEPDNGISTIDFRCTGSNDDRGWLKHYNASTNPAKMEFCVSDDPTTGEDFFSFGAASGNISNINATMTEWVKMNKSGIYHSGREVFHTGNCSISKTKNGYCKLANGLIIQWGEQGGIDKSTYFGNSPNGFVLPIAFSSLNYTVSGGCTGIREVRNVFLNPKTNSTFDIARVMDVFTNETTSITVKWIAIGY